MSEKHALSTLCFQAAIVTRLGNFWKFLGTKFHVKVVPAKVAIFCKKIRLWWKMVLFMLNWFGYFWRKFGYFLLQHLVTLQATPSCIMPVPGLPNKMGKVLSSESNYYTLRPSETFKIYCAKFFDFTISSKNVVSTFFGRICSNFSAPHNIKNTI